MLMDTPDRSAVLRACARQGVRGQRPRPAYGGPGGEAPETPFPAEPKAQLFTPPAVRPEMMRRWNSNTMITSGMVTMVPAAIMAA